MTNKNTTGGATGHSPVDRIISYCIDNKLVVILVTLVLVAWGIMVAPFDWRLGGLPRNPVPRYRSLQARPSRPGAGIGR